VFLSGELVMIRHVYKIFVGGKILKELTYPEDFIRGQGMDPGNVQDLVRIEKFILEGARKDFEYREDIAVEYAGAVSDEPL
jgi:hypothetical protein